MGAFSSCISVYAAAGETEQGQRGGEVSGDQRGRPAEWQPAVDDQEHDGREAEPSVLQQGDLTPSLWGLVLGELTGLGVRLRLGVCSGFCSASRKRKDVFAIFCSLLIDTLRLRRPKALQPQHVNVIFHGLIKQAVFPT